MGVRIGLILESFLSLFNEHIFIVQEKNFSRGNFRILSCSSFRYEVYQFQGVVQSLLIEILICITVYRFLNYLEHVRIIYMIRLSDMITTKGVISCNLFLILFSTESVFFQVEHLLHAFAQHHDGDSRGLKIHCGMINILSFRMHFIFSLLL